MMRYPQPQEWKASELSLGNIADYKAFTMVDGEGVRCSLYVSGCPFQCPGCYNRAAQSFRYGIPYTKELADQIMQDLAHDSVQGLTLLGGEPFLNTNVVLPLVHRIRQEFQQEKDIWSWTGFTWEELMLETDDKLALLTELDVLVDGRFMLAQRDLSLPFRGSANQRIIDVPASLKEQDVVLWQALL